MRVDNMAEGMGSLVKPLISRVQEFSRRPSQFDGGAVIVNVGIWHGHGQEKSTPGRDDFSFYKRLFDQVRALLAVSAVVQDPVRHLHVCLTMLDTTR